MILNPSWTFKYEAYWKSIHTYNKWFIDLRYLAILCLIILILISKFTDVIFLSSLQFIVIIFVTFFIFLYNTIFNYLSNKKNRRTDFNEIEFSLVQIAFDLFSLNILVYISGGIESPFIFFYMFHMIIGSMILPVGLVYSIAVGVLGFLFSFSYLEFKNIIYHQRVIGLLHFNIYNDISFISGYLFVVGFVMLVSIVLTNKIAQALYQRELQLKNALEELEVAEKTKQKYVMTVVHELKSPISASVSILDLVLGNYYGHIDDKIREKLERVRIRIDDSIESINNILRLSRFKLLNVIDKESFNISEMIEKLIDNQKPVAERKKIEIISKIDTAECKGDKTLLHLSISNILNNSIKYTKEDGIIEVILENKGKALEIEICDNGMGIPKNDLPNIFEEFYRGSNAKERNIEGTGTGLSIIKQIIESHNGNIIVESPSRLKSQTRQGTSFKIILPL